MYGPLGEERRWKSNVPLPPDPGVEVMVALGGEVISAQSPPMVMVGAQLWQFGWQVRTNAVVEGAMVMMEAEKRGCPPSSSGLMVRESPKGRRHDVMEVRGVEDGGDEVVDDIVAATDGGKRIA